MNRDKRLRRSVLLLALLVVAAIVTGVAASATNTLVPKQLIGRWSRPGTIGRAFSVSPRGNVAIYPFGTRHARFSHVTAHRLTISGGNNGVGSCPRPGTYRWTIAYHQLKLTKIHDACKPRVSLFSGRWSKAA
jgi:hypothetical protein